ncbi:MAG: ABC transporter permease subunit, partial [Clostridia bacterium]|nr:ABC transporter permease subunit [Clostridia bacterium]
MKHKNGNKKFYSTLNVVLPIATLLAVMAIYAIISKAVGIKLLAPSLSSVAKEFFSLFAQAEFYKAVGGTLGRAIAAYLLEFVFAVLFAAFSKGCPPLKRAFSPLIALVRVMPTMSIILLAIIWFNSYQSVILVAFCVIFPMLYTGFCDALDSVDKGLIEMAEIYNVDRKNRVLKLYLPQALPGAFTSIKSSVGLNLKLVIAAEVLAQTAQSVGVFMHLSK